ncbi:MAG TPA: dCMP deaminase [Streptosporangiaceae bacterium]|nr:dCMP deaminase [Streptosporangiaceae bacterium]
MAGAAASAARIPGDPDADRHWLNVAIDLSKKCPVSESAFSVGAVLVSAAGAPIATGYSRETGPHDHAEETALRRAAGAELGAATLCSSLEPCLHRASSPVSCAELIAASGVRRVVIAWLEPAIFQPGGGAAWLAARNIEVVHLSDLAERARSPNAHLLPR